MNNEQQLPDFVIADLYSKSLVLIYDEARQKTAAITLNESGKKYLGNYKNRIVVYVNDANDIYLNKEDFSFLSGILKACKLHVEHIALINYSNQILSFAQLKKNMQPEFLLCFGVNALQIELPFTMPDYQVQLYDKCQIITAPSLTALNQSKTDKVKLWTSLQKMFNLEKQ